LVAEFLSSSSSSSSLLFSKNGASILETVKILKVGLMGVTSDKRNEEEERRVDFLREKLREPERE